MLFNIRSNRPLPARVVSGLLLTLAFGATAARAEWPERPVKLILPYPAGSGPDVAMRPLADANGKELGQTVFIDNRVGAGGIVGIQAVAAAPPDGYTIGFGNVVTMAINPGFYSKLPYDPEQDLVPKNPGKVTMASGTGVGSRGHRAGELLKASAGIDMLHVPYKSGSQAIGDVAGGQVDVMFDNISGVQASIQSGRSRRSA